MIRIERRGPAAWLLLDRPAARNALDLSGWRALAEAARAVAASDAVVAGLGSAAPGMFCAGSDLFELARLADRPDERAPFRLAMRAAIDALAALPMPLVACVAGPCHGAGVALALAADVIAAEPGATFAIPPARLGIGYPAEDVARLAVRVGRGRAARLLFTGSSIDAAEALRIGLADAADGDALVDAIAANDRAALRALKAALSDPADPAHAAAFDAGFGGAAFQAAAARFRRADA